MLTARNQVSDLIEGFESGANDYLAKPVSKGELLSRIRTHLESSSYYREVKHSNERLESLVDMTGLCQQEIEDIVSEFWMSDAYLRNSDKGKIYEYLEEDDLFDLSEQISYASINCVNPAEIAFQLEKCELI